MKIIIFLFKMKFLKYKPEYVDFHFSNIRDHNGECQFRKVLQESSDLSLKIRKILFYQNSFINNFNFDKTKISIFFEKTIAQNVYDFILLIYVINWGKKYPVRFYCRNVIYSNFLKDYAKEKKVECIFYRNINIFKIDHINKAINNIKTKSLPKPKSNAATISSQNKNQVFSKNAKIASLYLGTSMDLELSKRNDVFWLLRSDISHNDVLIYADEQGLNIPRLTIKDIFDKGFLFKFVNFSARSKNSEHSWMRTSIYKKTMKDLMNKFIHRLNQSLFKLNLIDIRPFYLIHMFYFIKQYCYWYDFFESNNIKINMNPTNNSKINIPMNLALEESGGVSLSYHWSNLPINHFGLISTTDILFSFGPFYKNYWIENESKIRNVIFSGYITDHSFKAVSESSAELRQNLIKNGAKYIICYFDENSSNDKNFCISNDDEIERYKYLLQKVLDNDEFGVIFKPSYPSNIYERLENILGLIESAKKTGRCIFIDKGTFKTESYPSEIAQAADLCICLLISGTVALESFFSGTPTVFIDNEKLYSDPIYSWGKGTAVFDNFYDLFEEIQKDRNNSTKSLFGNISKWVEGKDPFRDGNASLRIGQYISWLQSKFDESKTREEAIEYANRLYAEKWGNGNVVEMSMHKRLEDNYKVGV